MPYDPYVTVTLRKDVVKQLDKIESDTKKSTSSKVSDAIKEYVETKTAKPQRKTRTIGYQSLSGTKSSMVIPLKHSE
jgi:metal-responsive CopG/Arc/MetJ family transcriptional regulator